MDINKVLIEHDYLVKRAAAKFPISEREDAAQEIRIWLYGALEDYDQFKESYPIINYVKNHIGFCLKRLYYDIKVQEKFEREHLPYPTQIGKHDNRDNYDELIRSVIVQLTPKDQVVFFSLLHDTKGRKYRKLAEIVRMEYSAYRNSVIKIKKITKNTIKNS